MVAEAVPGPAAVPAGASRGGNPARSAGIYPAVRLLSPEVFQEGAVSLVCLFYLITL